MDRKLAGIDGCPAGYVVALARPGVEVEFHILRSAVEVLALPADIIALDLPMGLEAVQSRAADREARRLLGPKRGTSVFSTPVRGALRDTYPEANAASRAICGKGISAQAFGIFPKIAQWDLVLTPEVQQRVYEAHPEVSFWWMNGQRPVVASKKTREGAAIRRSLLRAEEVRAADAFRARTLKRDVADDDILDALACLETARRIALGEHEFLPAEVPYDARGLRMAICY